MHTAVQTVLEEIAQCASRLNINLNGCVGRHDPHFIGPFALVYQGTLRTQGTRIAVKTILAGTPAKKDTIEEAVRELYNLSQIRHENVLPLLGITTEFSSSISIVSAWIENGNARDYVQEQSIDPRPLIDGIAQGLLYLHSHQLGPIIHGNLKGSNVLISPNGHALVVDFGLSPIFDSSLVAPFSVPRGCTPNWMAPENLESGEVTAKGDVWAFAMTVLELFTRKVPFHDCQSMAAVVFAIAKRQPNRPNMDDTYSRLTDGWWDLCCSCWDRDLSLRPSMPDIVEKIAFVLTEEPEVTLEELSRLASRFAINLNARIQRHENDKATSAYKEIFLLDVTHVTVQTIASNFSRHSLLAVKKNIREIQAWSKLRHENVLPVLGITTEFDGSIALVYERMDRGNAHDYVQDESVDPRPLIVEIALGLQYLHNHTPSPIFHGNLRGANVMISRSGHALLTNFGLHRSFNSELSISRLYIGDLAYMAPELLHDDQVSVKGDAWSFGATALELFIRETPFVRQEGFAIENANVYSSNAEHTLSRPNIQQTLSRLTDEWWDLCSLCWNHDPSLRPSMTAIVAKVLSNMSADQQGQTVTQKETQIPQISAIRFQNADDNMSAELTIGGWQDQISGPPEDGVLHARSSSNNWSYILRRPLSKAPQVNPDDCHIARCQYARQDNGVCEEYISCGTALAHFAAIHGIKNLSRDTVLICSWQHCGRHIARQNFHRHVREVHLGHPRFAERRVP